MNEFQRAALRARDIITLTETEPYDIPPPYHGMSVVNLFLVSPRRLRSSLVKIESECSSQSLSGKYLKSNLSKPPSDFPVL